MTDVVDKTASIIKDNVTGNYDKISSLVSDASNSMSNNKKGSNFFILK